MDTFLLGCHFLAISYTITCFVQFLDCVAVSDHFNSILSPTFPQLPFLTLFLQHIPRPSSFPPLSPYSLFIYPTYPSFSPSAAALLSPSVRAVVLMSDDKGGYTFYCPVRDSYSITGRLVTTLHGFYNLSRMNHITPYTLHPNSIMHRHECLHNTSFYHHSLFRYTHYYQHITSSHHILITHPFNTSLVL